MLDHRGEVFIPELGHRFHMPDSVRIFACQNPLREGGGRKGLPRSFLNRFSVLFVDSLQHEDLQFITSVMYPQIPSHGVFPP